MNMDITGSFEIAKLELQAGDSLVVKIDALLSMDQTKYIAENFKRYVPDGVKVMVLGRGMSIEVLKAMPA